MTLDEMIEGLVTKFKQEPRNKVFVSEEILLARSLSE